MAIEIRDEHGNIREVQITPSDEIRWHWKTSVGDFMLPRHPDFNAIKDTSLSDLLGKLSSNPDTSLVMIQRLGSSVNEVVTKVEFNEYMKGGEYDAKMVELLT